MLLSDSRAIMGGESVITLVGGTPSILDAAFDLAAECERLWSRFLSDSELCRLNAAAGVAVNVSPLTVALVDAMVDGVTLTDGDFNPTLLPPVIELGYAASLVEPTQSVLLPAGAQVFTDLGEVVLTSSTVQLPAAMTLDAGGIGKGFAADLIAAAVMASGARGVMVSMSGDVVVSGESPQPGGWLLGVENPFDESENLEIVRLREGAIVTSSQRKKRFGDAHHLIDPRTRKSAITTTQTVSVIADTGAQAEALAKAGFMRPASEFLAWLPSVNSAGMVIDADGSRAVSSNWSDYR